jgi:Peptidase family C25
MKKILSILLIELLFLSGVSAGVSGTTDAREGQTVMIPSEFDMVVITPEQFIEELAPLVAHKNSHGVLTFIKTVEEIFGEYQGDDQVEQIKYFIKDAYDTAHVQYVLLIGDIDHIPIRKTALVWEHLGDRVVPDVLTDLYYADLYNSNGSFASWDTNHDGVYSEILLNIDPFNETFEIIDDVEMTPEVMIGRLPCSTTRDVTNVVDKIITYETTTYGSEWFHRLILMGGDTFPSIGGISEGEVVTDHIASLLPEFTPIKLWTSLKTFRPWKINRELSKGAGFVSYSGHGLQNGIGTSEYDSSSQIHYLRPYILGIHNKQKYPVMYFDACLTGAFDYQVLGFDVPCFAWSFIKKHSGGAIACVASTRVSLGDPDDPFLAGTSRLHISFFEAYRPGVTLGEMFIQAQQSYIAEVLDTILYDPLTVQEYQLIGDPSLRVGGYEP